MKITILLFLISAPAFAQSPMESILTEDAIRALRDPFHAPNIVLQAKEAPRSDLESYALKDFKLNGVITTTKKAKALITLPNSKTYFVTIGDHVGVREGHVTSISGDSIKVVEYDHDDSGKRIPETFKLSISGDIISLGDAKEKL